MASARDILVNLLGKETVSPAAKKAGDALEDMGEDARGAARDAKRLDDEIEDLNQSLRGLAAAYVAAGTAAERADITKAIRIDERRLREKLKVSRLLEGAGTEAAGGFVTGLVARIGPLVVSKLPAALSPAVAAAAAGPAAVLAVTLGTAAAGAVIGGSAGVGILGGLAVASKDAGVKNAASLLGATIGDSLQDAARGKFVPATIESIGVLRNEFGKAEKDISRLFNASAQHLPQLAESGGKAARSMLSGIADLSERATPVVNTLAYGIERIGDAAETGMKSLSDNANEGADALANLLLATEAVTAGTLGMMNVFAEGYGWMTQVSAAMRGDFGPAIANVYEDELKTSDSTRVLTQEIRTLTEAAQQAAQAHRDQLNALTMLEDATRGSRMAVVDLKEGLAGLKQQTKDYGTSLDENTPKGRANLRYFDDLIGKADAAGDQAEALALANGASAEAAAAAGARVRETWVKDLIAAGQKAGYSKKEIEKMVAAARAADGERIRIYYDTIFRMFGKPYSGVTGIGGSTTRGYARGGMVEGLPGPRGVDSGLIAAANGEGVLNLQGMKAVGGKTGLDMLNKGVAGYRPRSSSATTGQLSAPREPAAQPIDYDRLSRAVARALAGAVFRIDDRTARIADLYRRAG